MMRPTHCSKADMAKDMTNVRVLFALQNINSNFPQDINYIWYNQEISVCKMAGKRNQRFLSVSLRPHYNCRKTHTKHTHTH